MKKHLFNRILSLVLTAVMVLGMLPAVSAAPAGLHWEKSDVEISPNRTDRLIPDMLHDQSEHKPAEMVRVSIVLENTPTIRAGYATMNIGSNADAMAYDRNLNRIQKVMERTISAQALDGEALDVVWNLTLVSNIISANVPYGKIESIKAINGVRDVVIERQYETTGAQKVSPDTYTSAGMIGSAPVWAAGMTGAGTRVAIIDTGTDTDHQSFDNAAYLHALEQNAAAKGMRIEDYTDSLNLLDTDEISSVLWNLNAVERIGAKTASDYFISEKLPFGANYVDKSLNVTHDYDEQGSHGSHVAGIAAANRYIPEGDAFADARDTVRMSGVAPDAQIITMKIFGAAPGPSDSDYFAAIEDAIWLGCDSVNLSLGSGSPGFAQNHLFADLLDFMATTDTVVVVSAGNSGHWAEYTAPANLYADGVSFHTAGSPGTYTNSLTVASVENDGTVGKYIQVGDHRIIYSETTGYKNAPISTLDKSTDGKGTAYEYVFIDGEGYAEDYKGIDLNGKVVFCHRGGDISFSDRANIAAHQGAAAIVICNNEPGVIGMDLSEYVFSAPCVSILQSDGAAVKAASARQTTPGGNVYYTGTVTVASEMGVTEYDSEYYTMSAFSSWGVPGSLELKPEITAPGGMIWSVNGMEPSADAYEMMSGTSMAAPQVTGMTALVAEYIKSQGLDSKTGLSVRHLAQSLLMSTAEPLREEASGDGYYSILNQGAGLARVDRATTAGSYVLVDGMADGKVKVELGDDPGRTGEYSFSFSIHDLSGKAMTYALSADVFTQGQFRDEHENLFLDTKTRPLGADVGFAVNGISLEGTTDGFACDLNGDGTTTAADADYLLEYLVGNETRLHADGDVNADGKVNSYDAHVLLTRQTGSFTVDVPANGSATVEVTLELTENTRELLNTNYPTGAYIQAYVRAEPIGDSEGVEGVTHSIPVLGYYGSWTEPSMYDVGSYMEYACGMETRTPYLNGNQSNVITVDYGDGNAYAFGGNPYTVEAEYLPERNAFNNQNGAVLQDLRYTQIRNAGSSRLTITNADTGEVCLTEEAGESEGAFFHINLGTWQNTQHRFPLNQDFAGISEGTRLNISLATAPEYYCRYEVDKNGKPVLSTDWESLAEGAYLTFPITIDNTAPELKEVKLGDDNTLSVTARDNEYIAAVSLMNADGTNVITSAPANQTTRGIEMTTELNLKYVFGDSFLVAVSDYAENTTVYELNLELDGERPYFTAIDRSNLNADNSANYVGMDVGGMSVNLAPASGRMLARAAEYVEGAVFEITHDNKLYVGYDQDLYSMRFLRDLDPNGEWEIVGFNDIAYNRADGQLYGLFYSKKNEQRMPYLGTLDLYSGELEVLGEMPIDAINLAIDGDGNFYSTIFANSEIPDVNLHKYTADVTATGQTIPVGELKGELEGDLVFFGTSAINSMAWDHKADKLYWGCTDGSFNRTALLEVDPSSGAVKLLHEYYFMTCGLYIAYEPEHDLFAPVNRVDTVIMPARESTLVGNTVQLGAQIAPWNASDWSVTWSSSNDGIATVDENGLVTGVNAGTAIITATSRLDPGKSASCTVTIETLDRELKGLVWDGENRVHWASFNTDAPADYESLRAITPNLPVKSTMMADGTLYASTLDPVTNLSGLYTVDPKTFEMTLVGSTLASSYLDLAYAPHNPGYGLGVSGKSIVLIDLNTGEETGFLNWGMELPSDLVGITYYDSQYSEDFSGYMDFFLILDADGNVYLVPFLIDDYGIDYLYGPYECYLQSIGHPVDGSYFQDFYYDGVYIYWTIFNNEDKVELMVWDVEDTGRIYSLGCFRAGVRYVGGLYTGSGISGSKSLLRAITTKELPAAAKGSLNAAVNTAKPMSKDDIPVAMTMPAEGTNGMMTVTYDAAKLELVSAAGKTDAFAWKLVKDGEVKVAFADRTALTAESVAAVLRFQALGMGETSVRVCYSEFNDSSSELLMEIPVQIPVHNPFTDVPEGSYYHDPVLWAVANGITSGSSATTFNPSGNCSRAQVVMFLWRAAGSPEPTSSKNPFTDVKEGDYFYKAVLWAVENKITSGATATTFNPSGNCSRAQVVMFLWRAQNSAKPTGNHNPFADVKESDYFFEAVLWAVENKITSGVDDTHFGPSVICKRAQVVTFLYSAMT